MRQNSTAATEGLTERLYRRILPVMMLSNMVISANSFIDSMFAGRCLGTQAMAVIGLFSPVSIILSGIATIFLTGAQQMCCAEMGNGNTKQLSRIFNSAATFLLGCGAVLTVLMLLLRDPLAASLGAFGDLKNDLVSYITGIAIGVIGQLLSAYLMPFLQINGKNRFSYLAMILNLGGNILFNTLFVVVFHMGLLGLGVATSLCNLLCLAITFPVFIKKEELVHFELGKISVSDLFNIMKIGSTVIMFQIGLFIKNYGMNRALLNESTVAAVAVVTLEGSLCGILGALPQGSGTAVQMLTSFYIGEGDKDSVRKLFRVALKTGFIIGIPVMALLLLLSNPVLLLFGIKAPDIMAMGHRMLWALSVGLLLNLVLTVFMRMLQAAEKLVAANVITCTENAFQGIFALLFVSVIGPDAAWIAFPIATSTCLVMVLVYGLSGGKKSRHDLIRFLHFPDKFWDNWEQKLSFTITTMGEVMEASKQLGEFFKEQGGTEKACMTAELSLEEMVGNVVQHGFKHQKNGKVWVLAMFHKNTMTLHIRDNCHRFNPKEYLKLNVNEPSERVGIRLVSGLAKSVNYQNIFGMNMLTIEVE